MEALSPRSVAFFWDESEKIANQGPETKRDSAAKTIRVPGSLLLAGLGLGAIGAYGIGRSRGLREAADLRGNLRDLAAPPAKPSVAPGLPQIPMPPSGPSRLGDEGDLFRRMGGIGGEDAAARRARRSSEDPHSKWLREQDEKESLRVARASREARFNPVRKLLEDAELAKMRVRSMSPEETGKRITSAQDSLRQEMLKTMPAEKVDEIINRWAEKKAFARSFWSEVEKIAVDAEELSRKTRAAKGVRIGTGLDAMGQAGALTIPPKQPMGALIQQRMAPAANIINKASDYAARLPRFGGDLSKKIQEGGSELLRGMEENIRAQTRAVGRPGDIVINPDLIEKVMPALGGRKGQPLSPAGKSALTGVITSHELAERRVKKRDIAPIASHLSPDVLFKEHNMLSRLTGAGSDEARDTLRAVRRSTGEESHVRRIVGEAIKDPRAQAYLAEGEKIPKAMRKHILRTIRANPAVANPPEALVERLARAPKAAKAQYDVAQVLMSLRRGVR